jgi:hypothetical protein
LQLPNPVISNILKKQVPECDRCNSVGGCALAHGAHPIFVFRVRARPRQFDCPEWQSGSLALRFDQRPPNRMHGNAVGFGVEGRYQRDYLDVRALPEEV